MENFMKFVSIFNGIPQSRAKEVEIKLFNDRRVGKAQIEIAIYEHP
jgi:hypothetical protein